VPRPSCKPTCYAALPVRRAPKGKPGPQAQQTTPSGGRSRRRGADGKRDVDTGRHTSDDRRREGGEQGGQQGNGHVGAVGEDSGEEGARPVDPGSDSSEDERENRNTGDFGHDRKCGLSHLGRRAHTHAPVRMPC